MAGTKRLPASLGSRRLDSGSALPDVIADRQVVKLTSHAGAVFESGRLQLTVTLVASGACSRGDGSLELRGAALRVHGANVGSLAG